MHINTVVRLLQLIYAYVQCDPTAIVYCWLAPQCQAFHLILRIVLKKRISNFCMYCVKSYGVLQLHVKPHKCDAIL